MDNRLLDYFLRVAELGSINKAASSLNLSQPALSRHMSALEHEMRAPLLTRTQSGVHLTEAGQILAARARPLLKQFALLKEQVGLTAAGQLAIGTPPAWHHLFTAPFAQRLLVEQPDIALQLHEGVSNVLRESMMVGLLDLSIVPSGTVPVGTYRQTPLVREPIVIVARSDQELSAHRPVPISHLDGKRVVMPRKPNVLRTQIEQSLERKGLAFRLAAETDTLELCLGLAQHGFGMALVPACTLYGHRLEGMSWAPIRGQFITWVLCENVSRSESRAVREGKTLVLETVAAALSKGNWSGALRIR
jgi:LysR family nitrogen assimilation transcriptional regulator